MATPQWLYEQGLADGWLDSRPCFNAGGGTVVFMRQVDKDSPSSLWTVPVTSNISGTPTQLFPAVAPTADNQASRPDWSWVDGRIALKGNRNGKQGLFLIHADGSSPQHVLVTLEGASIDNSQISYPSWYPDGKSVAVADYAIYRVLKVTLATSDAVELTHAKIWTGEPSVNQVSTDLICAAAQQAVAGGTYDQDVNKVWVKGADPSPAYMLSTGLSNGRSPWWSPRGDAIAFDALIPGSTNYGIYIYWFSSSTAVLVSPSSGWSCTHAKWHKTIQNRLVIGAHHLGHRSGIAYLDF